MINLRYHIVSLTAVFLAIGIGLAFGSSFLDQATVNSLERQLDGLQAGLADRDERISELNAQLGELTERQDSLDDEGAALLARRAEGVPVIVIANDGADEDAVDELVEALVVADADVAGVWRLTDRFVLDDDSELADLTEVTGATSQRPVVLRRSSVDALAALIARQQAATPTSDVDDFDTDPAHDDETGISGDPSTTAPGDDGSAADTSNEEFSDDEVTAEDETLVDGLFDNGFIEYKATAGGPDRPYVPAGARVVLVGGSEELPDDWMLLPLAERLQDGPDGNALVVVTSAVSDDDAVSSLVKTVRESPELRDRISSVEDVTHFPGQAAIVLVVSDLGSGPVGHYGLADGSTRFLPAPPEP